ncbi:MAG: ATP synthase F1 subunit gamma [Deltaproteobacteria bacterium]|jgi:F-type H+-transporting ATPase subunit gamma|nr:ATP synthase F1 subunit gamma [Deltaproteobacteria bacterium]
MASLKEIKQHISAVRQTQKLTKAMNMVAAAKLRATQHKTEAYEEYADESGRLLHEIGKRSPILAERLYTPLKDSDKVLLVVVTSDRGLCGSFNFNVFQKADKAILDARDRGLTPVVLPVGRKGRDYYKLRKVETVELRVPIEEKNAARGGDDPKKELIRPGYSFGVARGLANCLIDCHMTGYKEVTLVYTSFASLNRHPVEVLPLLPLSGGGGAKDPEAPTGDQVVPAPAAPDPDKGSLHSNLDYSIEPDAEELLKFLIPNSMAIGLYRASLESVTAENAARMQAMDNASKSCHDIIQSLTMAFNKARQASVTNELLDIVNGAEALKG